MHCYHYQYSGMSASTIILSHRDGRVYRQIWSSSPFSGRSPCRRPGSSLVREDPECQQHEQSPDSGSAAYPRISPEQDRYAGEVGDSYSIYYFQFPTLVTNTACMNRAAQHVAFIYDKLKSII